MPRYDYSTLRDEALAKLPYNEIPATYHYGAHLGQGCAFDAPGFPSYFIRSIYTKHGGVPNKGPVAVINHRVIARAEGGYYDDSPHAFLMSLWRPLPIDHPRVKLWIWECFRHWSSMYQHPTRWSRYGNAQHDLFSWKGGAELGRLASYDADYPARPVRTGQTDVEWERAEADWGLALIAAQNTLRPYVTIENHAATLRIRSFYPDYQPDDYAVSLMENPPKTVAPSWWERCASEEDAR